MAKHKKPRPSENHFARDIRKTQQKMREIEEIPSGSAEFPAFAD